MLTALLFPNQLGQFTQSLAVFYIKPHLILWYVAILLKTTILQIMLSTHIIPLLY